MATEAQMLRAQRDDLLFVLRRVLELDWYPHNMQDKDCHVCQVLQQAQQTFDSIREIGLD